MSTLESITGLATVGVVGFGLFLGYNIWQDIKDDESTKDIGEGVADIAKGAGKAAEGAGTLISEGVELVFVPDEDTLGEGQVCVNNAQCSSTGDPGGKSVGLDLLNEQKYGCCNGKCSEREKHPLGDYSCATSEFWVDTKSQDYYPALNQPCSMGQCSKSGFGGTERASWDDNPLNIHCCKGKCQILLNEDGERVPEVGFNERENLFCPSPSTIQTVVPKKNPTKALGGTCAVVTDCSKTGLYGDESATGENVECRNNICSRVDQSRSRSLSAEQQRKQAEEDLRNQYVGGDFRNSYLGVRAF